MSRRLRRVWSRLSGKNEDVNVNGIGDYGELRRTSSPPPMPPWAPNGHGRSVTLPPSANSLFERSGRIRSHSNADVPTSARNVHLYAATNGAPEATPPPLPPKVEGKKAVGSSVDAAVSSSALTKTHTKRKSIHEDDSPSQGGADRTQNDLTGASNQETIKGEPQPDQNEKPMDSFNQATLALDKYSTQEGLQDIATGVRQFAEGIPELMNVLDAISKIHPFVELPLMALRAAFQIEVTRRENNRKTAVLLVEMKSMMSVLTQLNRLPAETQSGSLADASPKAPLQVLKQLCKQTADDITGCSNACDAYHQKHLLSRCLFGASWEVKFQDYVRLFAGRKQEFILAMSVKTTVAMEDLKMEAKESKATLLEVQKSVERFTSIVEKLISPEQMEILAIIERKGGIAKLKSDDKVLGQVIQETTHIHEKGEDKLYSLARLGAPGSSGGMDAPRPSGNLAARDADNNTLSVKELRSEWNEGLDVLLNKNMETFRNTFELQQRLIREDLEKTVKRESDRVIKEFKAGPHDRIVDKDLHTIWVNMGWKGSVKAKHFVLAVRDFYFEKTHLRKHQGGEGAETISQEYQDGWAVEYLDLVNLQAIHEAIDDDGSGFITVEEVNQFTKSRPSDWSLLKWFAFWAVGSNMAMVQQSQAIDQMLDEMISLLPLLLPENQSYAREYLHSTWETIVTFTTSLSWKWSSQFLQEKFKDYIQSEEDRIKKNLVDVKYRIDTVDALYLVTGTGRIEMNFFPLAKALLERHRQIFHIARSKLLHEEELEDAAYFFSNVEDALDYRLYELQAICTSSGRNPTEWLKEFGHGIYEYRNDPSLVWSFDKMIRYQYSQEPYDSEEPFDDSNYLEILHYGEGRTKDLDTSAYEEGPLQLPAIGMGVVDKSVNEEEPALEGLSKSADHPDAHPLIGTWQALLYNDTSYIHPCQPPVTTTFKPAETQAKDGVFAFTATGVIGGNTYSLNGTCQPMEDDQEKLSVAWTMKYSIDDDEQHFRGTFDKSAMRINGTTIFDSNEMGYGATVVLSQQSPDVVIYRPHPAALADPKKKITMLWQFAYKATVHKLRKQTWSWSYFEARRDLRKKYLDLALRFDSPWQSQELLSVQGKLLNADQPYLESLVLKMSTLRIHVNRVCDCCGGRLITDRIICLECKPDSSSFNTVDMCHDRACTAASITRGDLTAPHTSSHRTFKTRKLLLIRDLGRAWSQAEAAIDEGDQAIKEAMDSYEEESAGEGAEKSNISEGVEKTQGHAERSESALSNTASEREPGDDFHASCTGTNQSTGSAPSIATPPLIDMSRLSSQSFQGMVSAAFESGSAAFAVPEQLVDKPSATTFPVLQKNGQPAIGLHETDYLSTRAGLEEGVNVPEQSEEIGQGLKVALNGKEEDRHSANGADSEAPPLSDNRCYFCGGKLTSPSWYCLDCDETTLICEECDPVGGFEKGQHEKEHTLLKVYVLGAEDKAPDDKHDKRLKGLEDRLMKLEDRLMKFDGMLEKLVQWTTAMKS